MAEVSCCATDHEILLAILETENGSFDRLQQVIQAINGSGGGGGGGNVNLTGINAVPPSVNNGTADAGTLRVTIASDSTGSITVVSGSPTGTYTNRSGTVTLGGASQQIAAANASRKAFFFENISSETLWLNFTTAAVQNQPSIAVLPYGVFWLTSEFISTEAINVIGATTGSAFTAKEG